MKKIFVLSSLAVSIIFASCGGGNSTSTSSTSTEQAVEESTESVVPGIENVTISNTWKVEGSDQMKFDTELIRVKAGEEVILTLKNVGTLSKESMGHNLVVLASGTDLPTFASEAASALGTEYIPESTSIVAHTKLLGPGEEDKITFKLEKGVYDYICSFPGHYALMKGKIVAE